MNIYDGHQIGDEHKQIEWMKNENEKCLFSNTQGFYDTIKSINYSSRILCLGYKMIVDKKHEDLNNMNNWTRSINYNWKNKAYKKISKIYFLTKIG